MDTYSWPGPYTPFAHQRTTSQFIVDNPRCFVFNEMGLGKSAAALWAIDHLMCHGQVKRVLIVAPLSIIRRVWEDEAFKLLMHRRTVVLYGTAARRRSLYAGEWEIAIINFDGLPAVHDLVAQDIASKRLDMCVVDEASAYRNSRTKRWKLLHALAQHLPRCVLMTGTPCPESPEDAYGLARLLGVANAPRCFTAWRDTVMRRKNRFVWEPRDDGYARAYELLQPAIRFTKDECLDLPPMTIEDRAVSLTDEQRIAYRQMQKQMLVEFQDSGDALTALSAADKLGKLRQIACGVVRDTQTGEYLLLDHKPRVQVVLEAIRESLTKVIVVVPFKGMIQALAQELATHYSVAVINGDVPISQRNEIIAQFRSTPNPHVLLVHPKVAAHGLTLTEASTLVFYGPIYSGEETKQVIERINRPGQEHKMTVVRLGATNLEWNIYDLVEKKTRLEDELLGLYERAMRDSLSDY